MKYLEMKQKDTLVIIILLFIFIMAWIGSSIYHSAMSSTISETTSKEISPIEPAFDTKTINKLKERQRIAPAFELGNITQAPIASSAPETTFQKNASEGGSLLNEKSGQ